MPVYLTLHRPSKTRRLVRAPNRAQALCHVSDTEFAVDVASADELIENVQAGVVVETAGEQAAATDQDEHSGTLALDGVR